MKPIIIVPPDAMSADDIARLNDNDLCVVVATDPECVRFLDPIPAASARNEMENAAIQLSRRLLDSRCANQTFSHSDISRLWLQLLIKGTPFDSAPTQQEQEKQIFDAAKRAELERLAREEARAERLAKRTAGRSAQ